MKKTVTRFAPSPTGTFHIGTARTALFNFLYAKQNDGEMILRIEDTDTERSKKEFEDDILESLEWLGIKWDGDTIRQSERGEVYKTHLKKLIDSGDAYVSKEEEGERDEVIRFKNPGKTVTFEDMVRGEVTFDTTELGDFVIAKSETEPLYHLAVVIDDMEGGVTHVVRGEDHISNTPRQILLQEALGAERPIYAHLPLILAPDRTKLSKRHGAVSVGEYRELGYLSEAIVNYLALLGWHPEGEQEIFSMEELIKEFQIDRIQKGGAIFDIEKLNWLNKEYIKNLSDENFKKHVDARHPWEGDMPKKVYELIRERIDKFSDVDVMAKDGEFSYYTDSPEYSGGELVWKDATKEETKEHLEKAIEMIGEMTDAGFTADVVKAALWNYATEKGRGDVLWPIRYALSGKEKSPDPFTLAEVLGKEETISRLKKATQVL